MYFNLHYREEYICVPIHIVQTTIVYVNEDVMS